MGEELAQCSETTDGVVTELVEYMDYDSQNNNRIYTYRAVAEYTVNDVAYSSENKTGYGRERGPYAVGDEVAVHYNPDDPSKCFLERAECQSSIHFSQL